MDQMLSSKDEPLLEEVDLSSLAPRKIDWDLKRNLAQKMEKLEKRTQRAIVELIRERLKGSDNLVEATQALDSFKSANSKLNK